jgi:hypothetical protein
MAPLLHHTKFSNLISWVLWIKLILILSLTWRWKQCQLSKLCVLFKLRDEGEYPRIRMILMSHRRQKPLDWTESVRPRVCSQYTPCEIISIQVRFFSEPTSLFPEKPVSNLVRDCCNRPEVSPRFLVRRGRSRRIRTPEWLRGWRWGKILYQMDIRVRSVLWRHSPTLTYIMSSRALLWSITFDIVLAGTVAHIKHTLDLTPLYSYLASVRLFSCLLTLSSYLLLVFLSLFFLIVLSVFFCHPLLLLSSTSNRTSRSSCCNLNSCTEGAGARYTLSFLLIFLTVCSYT